MCPCVDVWLFFFFIILALDFRLGDYCETVPQLSQCLLPLKCMVINPTFAHLFGGLPLALLNPSITQGSRINGMQRKAVSARRHAGRIPAASTSQSGEEHWSRNRSKYLSHILNAWWQVSFLWVLILKNKTKNTQRHKNIWIFREHAYHPQKCVVQINVVSGLLVSNKYQVQYVNTDLNAVR